MPLEITDNDIEYAERILFNGQIKCFDQGRIDFIKNLSTIDLQAVPGSGKTTALLAKLLILERYMPFPHGQGILVLSHTNTAVDEIKERIGEHCPNLFQYPNFVGTIQSFVDRFLVIPYCLQKYNARVNRFDTALFKDRLYSNYLEIHRKKDHGNLSGLFRIRHRDLKADEQTQRIRSDVRNLWCDFNTNRITIKRNARKALVSKPANPRHQAITQLVEKTIKEGYMSYEYSYHMADLYINHFPKIKRLLQERFKYVFVDEMQDMDEGQHNVLQKVFGEGIVPDFCFQRIGDKNQAIYSGRVSLNAIWSPSEETLSIANSRRLSQQISSVVQNFALENEEIVGENEQANNRNFTPHIITYTDDTIEQVLPRFTALISELTTDHEDIDLQEKVCKAVGWKKQPNNPNQIAISSYFSDFQPERHSIKEVRSSFAGHFNHFDPRLSPARAVYNSILEALVTVLRLQGIRNINDKFFTRSSFMRFLQSAEGSISRQVYVEIQKSIAKWMRQIINEDTDGVVDEAQRFTISFIHLLWGLDLNENARAFLIAADSGRDAFPDISPETPINTYISPEGLRIPVTTVHKVKGETHFATLYMEVSYQDAGEIGFESQRLIEQFLGNPIQGGGTYTRQSARIAYVALSRATDIICFACHEDRIQDRLADFNDSPWTVISC